MMNGDYRIDKETGAVIFKKNAGRKLSQRICDLEKQNEELQNKVEELTEIVNSILQERRNVK